MGTLGQALRFFLIGTTGTAAYAGLYLVLRTRIVDTPALVLAWLLSTLATNLAHRYVTFGVSERRGRVADAVVFLATSLLGLGLTTWLLTLTRDQGSVAHTLTIVLATGIAGIVRFLIMRAWLRIRTSSADAGVTLRADAPAPPA